MLEQHDRKVEARSDLPQDSRGVLELHVRLSRLACAGGEQGLEAQDLCGSERKLIGGPLAMEFLDSAPDPVEILQLERRLEGIDERDPHERMLDPDVGHSG